MNAPTLNGRMVKNIEIDGVDRDDYPDFCDAFFSYAEYEDGTPLSDDELETLGDENPDLINSMSADHYTDSSDNDYDYDMDR